MDKIKEKYGIMEYGIKLYIFQELSEKSNGFAIKINSDGILFAKTVNFERTNNKIYYIGIEEIKNKDLTEEVLEEQIQELRKKYNKAIMEYKKYKIEKKLNEIGADFV